MSRMRIRRFLVLRTGTFGFLEFVFTAMYCFRHQYPYRIVNELTFGLFTSRSLNIPSSSALRVISSLKKLL